MKATAHFSYTLKQAHKLIQVLHNLENHRWRDAGERSRLVREGVLPEFYASCLPDVPQGFFRARPERWAKVADPVARRLVKRLAECWKDALVEVVCWTGGGLACAPRTIKLDEVDATGRPRAGAIL